MGRLPGPLSKTTVHGVHRYFHKKKQVRRKISQLLSQGCHSMVLDENSLLGRCFLFFVFYFFFLQDKPDCMF